MRSVLQDLAGRARGGMVHQGAVVLVLTHGISVFNVLFHRVMGQHLPADEYAVLVAMLSVFMVFSTPFLALQNTMARFTAVAGSAVDAARIRGLMVAWSWRVGLFGLLLLAASIIGREPLRVLWRLEDARPVVVTGVIIGGASFIPLLTGVLQGAQRFVAMALTSMLWCAVRLFLGALLVVRVAPAALQALYAQIAGIAASLLFGGVMVLRYHSGSPPPLSRPLPRTDGYFMLSMLSLLAYALLMNSDVPLVRMLVEDSADVEAYSRAAMIARTLIFLAQPLAAVLFARTAGASGTGPLNALRTALLMTAGLTAAAVVACLVLPRWPILFFFGSQAVTPHLVTMVRLLCVAVAPLGLVFLLLHFELARHRFHGAVLLGLCALGFGAGAWRFHASLQQVVLAFAAANTLALAGMIGLVWGRAEGRTEADKTGDSHG